ncbi:hypothetical protein ACP70R_042283 [Stipagrostis hirtigluma subsp. patula]
MENPVAEVSEEERRDAFPARVEPPASSSTSPAVPATSSSPPDAPSHSTPPAAAGDDENQVVAAPARGVNTTPSDSTDLGLGHAEASAARTGNTGLASAAHAGCSTSEPAVKDHDAVVSEVVPAPANSSPASVVAVSSAAATTAEGDPQVFDGTPCRPRASILGVLHVIVGHAIYPVTEEVLRQVFDLFGVVEKVHIYNRTTDRVAAFVKYQSCREAVLAREVLHGRCIYDGCCWLDVQFVHSLLSSCATASSSAASIGVSSACSPPADRPSGPAISMMTAAQSLSWSDLPPEILGLVLKRLPSLADHVRLRAVCHPWCSNAWLQPMRPPIPWLALPNGTFLSIPDGEIIRMPVLDDSCCYGSIDNYLFLVDWDGECSLMDPFSEDILELPPLATICRREMDEYPPYTPGIFDCFGKLLILDIDESIESKPKISSMAYIIESTDVLDTSKHIVVPYLVECAGRLLMVRRWVCPIEPRPIGLDGFDSTGAFEVFEAELSSKPSQWRRVNDLGGQALFVGSSCSKSFPAGKYSGVQENCIYFMNDYPRLRPLADPLHDSGVYNMRNGVITPLLSETAAVPQNLVGQWRPTWFFPNQAL